jgi:regulator of replication initiation timing
MLNWRPVRGIELEIEQIKKETEQIKSETEQIKSETEQLRLENARLRQLNAKGRALLSCVDQHCFPPESSSIPPQPTEIDCGPSSP